MRKPFSFDTQLEAARALPEQLRLEAKVCVDFVTEFARQGAAVDDERFLVENGRFQAFVTNGASLTNLLAELVSVLDTLTVKVSADLDSFRGLTPGEKFIGRFSRQRMWRRHSARVRAAPVVERLRDLLVKSNETAAVIASYRTIAIDFHKLAEHGLIGIVEQRRRLVDRIDIARLRIRELNAKALTTQGRIGLYGSRAEWERMEEERRALKAQADRASDEERGMREDSQRRERFINLFQVFVDALNRQVGQCNVLGRKMVIDTEERLLIYQAQVDTDIPGSKVQISAELFPAIAGPIELFERNMLVPQELEHRKRAADAAFANKFETFGPEADDGSGEPLIDATKISKRLRFRFLRS
ncbi:hypothetical protein ATY81_15070 [Rhizobium sp. R72]|uniref:hypothetical protein n=1 Tax=unclassified Rhizobium TaxID=2613769 RepID=UPI000B52CED8|nr:MULTISPECIES: hypothetical protein [unclassified Rhizobium]OWV93193.1 hypothetical protein ATY81_15070 [Rhizobium sp. R72]OWV93420.1 hypothetical protein ATY80_15070 [Rhizobium sp. R711]